MITQRFSPTNKESTKTLTKNPHVPIKTPAPQLNHQLNPRFQLQPSQKASKPYGNRNKGPLTGPISADRSKTASATPSTPEEDPRRTCSKVKGSGNASLKRAPPIGK